MEKGPYNMSSFPASLSSKTVDEATKTIVDHVHLKRLPEFGVLSKQVCAFQVSQKIILQNGLLCE